MNHLSLSLAYLKHNIASAWLTVITFAAGIAVIVALLLVNAQVERQFTNNLQGIDLVVSGKGSPLQIILSAVFQIDIPTGNVPAAEADKLAHSPLVKEAIPMALGDNYNGAHIVGTDMQYVKHYHGEFAQGRGFAKPMEALLGADVAEENHLKVGDKIIGAHGLVNSEDLHKDFPYTVVGILQPNGSVLDRVVVTPVESVWKVHEHPDADDPDEVAYKKAHPEKELTALLIHYQSPMAAVVMPRQVNKNSSMQAASPAFEMARLTSLLGFGVEAFGVLGWFLIVLAGFGIFTALYHAMRERKYDLALMRSFGAPPRKLFALVLTESLVLTLSGIVLGIFMGHLLVECAALWLMETKHLSISGWVFLPSEFVLALAALLIGLVAAAIPAIRVYKIDIFRTLVQG